MINYLSKEGLNKLVTLIAEKLSFKQDKIDDIQSIRNNAALGATALQKHQDISGKADKAETLEGYGITDAYTKDEIDSIVSATYRYIGSVNTVEDLPEENNKIGDVYEVVSENANYAWDGTEWKVIGAVVDISNKADKADTLAGYGIKNAYTKEEIHEFIYDDLPLIEDDKSYIIKDTKTFNEYKEITSQLYQLTSDVMGYYALSPMGGSGIYVNNNSDSSLTMLVKVKPHNGGRPGFRYGHAALTTSPSGIFYKLANSDVQDEQTGRNADETLYSVIIPAGRKGYFLDAGSSTYEDSIEIISACINGTLTVKDGYQAIKIKPTAILPEVMILSKETYDAIEPKSPTVMYYILKD